MVDPSPQSPFVFQIPCSSPLRGAQHFGSIPKRNKHAGMQLDRVPLRISAQGFVHAFFLLGTFFFVHAQTAIAEEALSPLPVWVSAIISIIASQP